MNDFKYNRGILADMCEVMKTDVLKQVKDFIGNKPLVYLEGSCLDIDTIEDFEKAANIIIERRKNNKNV